LQARAFRHKRWLVVQLELRPGKHGAKKLRKERGAAGVQKRWRNMYGAVLNESSERLGVTRC
jgi:hypothetical protein